MSIPLGRFIDPSQAPRRLDVANVPDRLLTIQRNFDDIRESFEERHGKRVCDVLQKEVEAFLVEWQSRHPKRHVAFTDLMGLCCIEIDGKEISDWFPGSRWKGKRGPLEPLFALEDWYTQVSDSNFKYCIDTITLEPLLPIHEK
jgi:diadenosine tetraphosphatase ApaH/serine/threonine PP2A family protein phosphatase